ncbi:MAG TPA: RNA polymerase sigma factor [Planctomycetota bacterium]|nr:RNA polymerase sigma factor [Planctomycetota bacterium]
MNSNETGSEPNSDRALLARFVAGDVGAFEALLERYERPLLRFAARYSPGLAQDLVQEAFLRLVRDASTLDGVTRVSSWLYRVVRNLAIDEARKEERRMERHKVVAGSERLDAAQPFVETKETRDLVSEKLRGLPEKQRDVLILRIQEEKTYREISEITGLTTSYVGYLIHQGLRTLAHELKAAGVI